MGEYDFWEGFARDVLDREDFQTLSDVLASHNVTDWRWLLTLGLERVAEQQRLYGGPLEIATFHLDPAGDPERQWNDFVDRLAKRGFAPSEDPIRSTERYATFSLEPCPTTETVRP